jgi:DNA (cytosine-5)-methyltransferase 1
MIDLNQNTHSLTGKSFIDLFAGIGGFHLALSSLGAQCIFASEWDKSASEVYFRNFGFTPAGDITKIQEQDIPNHDILCAGFPCQAFSISGKQKGFEDTRGTLFFEIARIVSYHKPQVVFLENVKNFVQHENGNTFRIVKNTLNELGYNVFYSILNSNRFGIPQNRERIYIVAFRKDIGSQTFKFPNPINKEVAVFDILEKSPDAKIIERNDINIYKSLNGNGMFRDKIHYFNKPMQIGIVNKGGQGERIYHPAGHAITLSAYGGGVGSKTGLYQINDKIRKLSPRECARLQGFPEDFIIDSSQTQAYKQFGNSVTIDVLQYIAINIAKVLKSHATQ